MRIYRKEKGRVDHVQEWDDPLNPITQDPVILVRRKKMYITSDKQYPYEIIPARKVRFMNVIRPLGHVADVIDMPNVSALMVAPVTIGVGQQAGPISYEWEEIRTQIRSITSTSTKSTTTPAMGEGTPWKVRAIDDKGHSTDWEGFVVHGRALGYMVMTGYSHTMPTVVTEMTSSNFTITAALSTSLTNMTGVYIVITGSRNVTLPIRTGIGLTDTIDFDVSANLGQSFIKFMIEDPSGYRTAEERIDFTVVKNTIPTLDGFTHTLPATMTVGETVNFQWGGVTDADGDIITMKIVSVVGGTASIMDGITEGMANSVNSNNPSSGTVRVEWYLTDGHTNTRHVVWVIKVLDFPPNVDNVTYTIDGVTGSEVTIEPCRTYSVIVDGAVDPHGADINTFLTSPPEITFGDSTARSHQIEQGVPFPMHVGCNINGSVGSYVMATFENANAGQTAYFPLNTMDQHGYAYLSSVSAFTKPSGVTTLVIRGQGGIGVGSTVTGISVNVIFQGAIAISPIYPDIEERLVVDIPAEQATLVVTPAPGTSISLMW